MCTSEYRNCEGCLWDSVCAPIRPEVCDDYWDVEMLKDLEDYSEDLAMRMKVYLRFIRDYADGN